MPKNAPQSNTPQDPIPKKIAPQETASQQDAAKQAQLFWECARRLDCIYESYAKKHGLSYTSLSVLHIVAVCGECTQKELCEELFLPKQTVNSAVAAFQRQGLMEMTTWPEDRRHKVIRLTAEGQRYAQSLLPRLENAEVQSIGQFSPAERRQLLALMERYEARYQKELAD